MRRDLPGSTLLRVLPASVGIRRKGSAREVQHVGQHPLDAERPEQRRGRLQQQPEPVDLLGRELLFLDAAFDVLSRQKAPTGWANCLTLLPFLREGTPGSPTTAEGCCFSVSEQMDIQPVAEQERRAGVQIVLRAAASLAGGHREDSFKLRTGARSASRTT